MSTVPVFSPDGTLGDIPHDQLMAAIKAGAKPGVHITSPDGKPGVIPADRTADAVKAGAKLEPFADQPVKQPGFWAALGSDLSAMVPHSLSEAGDMAKKKAISVATMGASDVAAAMEAGAERAKEGHGKLYIAGAAANEVLGVNVKGEEQSAESGDVGGVLGHAATVPAVMAATAGLAKGSSAIADHPAFIRASNAIKNVTPKQAAQVIGGTAGAVEGHGTLSAPGAYYGAKTGGKVAEGILGKERANQPIFKGKVAPDATAENVPFAGELDQMTDGLAQQIAEKNGSPRFNAEDRLKAKSLLQDSLKHSTADVVDSAIKPGGANHGANIQTKAKVDFYLQRGDVAGAEQALDAGAQTVNPAFDPAKLFAQRQGKVPSTMEIRQRVAAETPGSRADVQETKGIQEAMRENLQRHEWSAESEARREFIARNTTGFTKTWGTQAQRDAAHQAALASQSEDMTDLLRKSLAEVQAKKAQ